jgi:hypothetical protein
MMPEVEIVQVTPALAAEWLALNTHNRHPRRNVVNAYAADMSDGHWQFNGDAIRFDDDGKLIDGQHRLAASIEADVTLPMLVVRGLAPSTQETVDGGAKRMFADVLKLRGEVNSTSLAAVTRRVTLWEAGARRSEINVQATNAQMSATLDKYPWLRDIIVPAKLTAEGSRLTPSVAGLCWWLFTRIDGEDAEAFMARLRDGQHLAAHDPVYELRQAIAKTQVGSVGSRSPVYLTAITIKAWNAYRRGGQVTSISYRPGGAQPEKFPEPE